MKPIAAVTLVLLALLGQAAGAQDLFAPVASVLTHPRCLNCHTTTAYPRQGDQQLPHTQNVQRGGDNKGSPVMRCVGCHQPQNQDRVPGAADWHLAPLSMGWEGRTPAQICAAIKNPARNGGRKTAKQIVEHMVSDPLVLWAWAPGAGRSTPPLSHADFVVALKTWAERGMPCPH